MTGIERRTGRHLAALAALLVTPMAASANLSISSAATENMSCSDGICAPTAAKAVLNVTDLENLLSAGNMTVTTTGSGVQAGDIQIDGPLTWSTGSTLTLDAYDSMPVEQPVTKPASAAFLS
jgi:hypothetical protein